MSDITPGEAAVIAEEAYIFGYPLVLMDITRRVMTHTTAPDAAGRRAPANQFAHMMTTPDPTFRGAALPNVDTLLSTAWLDLSGEPVVLSLPDTHGRFYLMPILDAWTNVFTSLGKRTTGTGEGHFAITGPDWVGALPAGVQHIEAPTSTVWVRGRTQLNGSADAPNVHALQRGFRLTPLSAWGAPYTPPEAPLDPSVNESVPPQQQIERMSAPAFYSALAILMKANPPRPNDAPVLARLARLGIVPGQPFAYDSFDPAIQRAIDQAPTSGWRRLQTNASGFGRREGGWQYALGLGEYDTRYMLRAVTALIGLGATLAADALYPYTDLDASGVPLNGSRNYTLHFAPGATPPVNAFWSLTAYGSDHYLVANLVNRYALGNRDPLHYNADGSLDISIQHASPGPDREANWLPAPEGGFNLILRMYWPKPEALNQSWLVPAVELAPWTLSSSSQPEISGGDIP